MVVLIILNILLVVFVVFLLLYIFINNDNSKKNVYKKYDDNDIYCECDKNENDKHNKKIKQERIFDGKFITDEEYQKIIKNKRSDISILLEDINNEYEYLKELNYK